MPRFIFPEWTETLKRWINLLVLGAPVYLVALVAYGVFAFVIWFLGDRKVTQRAG